MNDNKEIKNAIMQELKYKIDCSNYGGMSSARRNFHAIELLRKNNIKIEDYKVLQNGMPIYKIVRNFASRKVNGMYKELNPKLEVIGGIICA